MSCTPGKVEVVGVQEVQGTEAFVLRFLQCRDDEWIGKVFFAKFDPKAIWRDLGVLTCFHCVAGTRVCLTRPWVVSLPILSEFARRYDDLEPLPGMSLPWEEAGLPRPCVDEPCQVEWMDEFLEPVYPLEVV